MSRPLTPGEPLAPRKRRGDPPEETGCRAQSPAARKKAFSDANIRPIFCCFGRLFCVASRGEADEWNCDNTCLAVYMPCNRLTLSSTVPQRSRYFSVSVRGVERLRAADDLPFCAGASSLPASQDPLPPPPHTQHIPQSCLIVQHWLGGQKLRRGNQSHARFSVFSAAGGGARNTC